MARRAESAVQPADGPRWLALAGWLALSLAAGGAGGIASANAGGFYAQLARPAWAPPSWLFGPTWTLLYVMMGVAAWLVWRERSASEATARLRHLGLSLFVVQLALNALWTWLFFRWRLGGWAFAELVVLALLVAATALAFYRIRPLAGWLLAPYLAWLSYAGALNWAVWRNNPGLL
jgi:tryptophan-rich sensory protein